MAGALETLCGQTYGAEQYARFGNYSLSSIVYLMGEILVSFGQDPLISDIAGKYSICLIPALFGYAVLQSLVRYFQTQSLICPVVTTSCVVLCLHMPLCWVLVFKFGHGNIGAALAIGISYWLSVTLLDFT